MTPTTIQTSKKKSGAAIAKNPSPGTDRSTASGFNDSVSQTGGNVNKKVSMRLPVAETEQLVLENGGSAAAEETDSEGRDLTAEQAEFFRDSKVRDEAGNLRVLYRGQNENYAWFKPDYRGAIWATTYQPYARNIGKTWTKRYTTDSIARMLDETNLSYADIDKALRAIVNDHGQENYAAASGWN